MLLKVPPIYAFSGITLNAVPALTLVIDKTALLKGSIFLDNHDITSLPMYKRARKGIGYLAQEASVFRNLSVEDNLYAILESQKISKEDQHSKAEKLLNEFGLQEVRKNLGRVLSGGERRRTEIARALA